MNRQRFLSLVGLSAIGTGIFAARNQNPLLSDCDDPVTPSVPEGPYFKDEKMKRSNIRENKAGVPVQYRIRVEDRHCKPVAGAIVNIWQCDAEGHYSDFEAEHTLSQTWLRGYQVTDKRGECQFDSIFPGWYTGRLTHVHAKVQLPGKEAFNTNFFFTREIEQEAYKHHAYTKGENPVTIAQDFELRGDKDNARRDALLMKIDRHSSDQIIAHYKIILA